MSSRETRYAQLESYWRSWQQGAWESDLIHAILASIGYLRRAGLSPERMRLVRSVEIAMRDHVETVVAGVAEFLAGTTLPERSLRLQDEAESDLVAFYQDRDDAELAWQLVREYIEEENAGDRDALMRLRRTLDEVDDNVLLEPKLVSGLREIGSLEPLAYFDPDFFWWLPAERGECQLPGPRRDQYLARYVEQKISDAMCSRYQRHLQQCNYCHEQVEIARRVG